MYEERRSWKERKKERKINTTRTAATASVYHVLFFSSLFNKTHTICEHKCIFSNINENEKKNETNETLGKTEEFRRHILYKCDNITSRSNSIILLFYYKFMKT